ncbi:MAG: c-type cytochrome [Verrucomicrobia bacterium]|nr:MAG: c-type cytochrome [Verrucomicrobiota bacterium]
MRSTCLRIATLLLAAASSLAAVEKKHVVLIAGRPSHGPGEHEHNAGVLLLAKCLQENAAQLVDVKVHLNAEWPAAEELRQADTILIYSDGAGGHPALQDDHLQQLTKQMERGCGFVCLHFAVEVPVKPGGAEFKNWLGGYFETFWSVNPVFDASFKDLPKHPICKGVKPFATHDEWYFHMRFQDAMRGVTPILSTTPAPQTVSDNDGDRCGNPAVRLDLKNHVPQTTAWATERADGGRGFGFTGGHYHQGWSNDQQRKLVLNAIVWSAKGQVPADGINSKLSAEDILKNLDDKGQGAAKKPAAPAAPAAAQVPPGVGYGVADAIKNMATFQTPAGLEATLFAAEPMIQNPTNIDIDHRGRVWATECVNYRGRKLRDEGDRVVILESTHADGVADREKTFFQSKELINPLGICVLPQAKGTKVIVSAAPNVWLLTDNTGNDVADESVVIFKVGGSPDHDHQIHAFSLGPDGKFYFNAGNALSELMWPDGSIVKDIDGNEVTGRGKPYRQGMVFRCDIDLKTGKASHVEVLGHNFRNNYKVAVDSFGTLWQSDNDDDGNQAVRINYVMEYGNYGYSDEMTGAGWSSARTNLEKEIPRRHWHLNDPGVVPNLLHTGAGGPTGIVVNEGKLLGEAFTNQIIHCDPGPRTVRAYPVTKDGAGYEATMVNILTGTDSWYRASDAAIGCDGSLFVADWYDPGVGGHGTGDNVKGHIRGRVYRVAPTGSQLSTLKVDVSTPAGAIVALESPNRVVRGMAWQALHAQGEAAIGALGKLWRNPLPRLRARALGVLAQTPGHAISALTAGFKDPDADVRIWALRLTATLARSEVFDAAPLREPIAKLLHDPSPAVRRQIAIYLRGQKDIGKFWTALALQHDGKDRWYLEALGIGSAGNEDACFEAWIAAVGKQWNTPGGRDIVWRLRSSKTAAYLVKILADASVLSSDKPRFLRAFDFLPASAEKQAALIELARNGSSVEIAREALVRLKGSSSPELASMVQAALTKAVGTPQFVLLVRDFGATGQAAALLETAVAIANDPAANDAIQLLYQDAGADALLDTALTGKQAAGVIAVLGSSGTPRGLARLGTLLSSKQAALELRQQAVRALSRSQTGATTLVQLAKDGHLPAELAPAAASALRMVQYPTLTGDINTLFPAPAALGGKALATIPELAKMSGDVVKGHAVFERPESSCITCHRIGKLGVDVAPALDLIGAKLTKEQLYDAILNPNASLSMGFETTQLALKDGSTGFGIIRSETAQELVLALPGGSTQKFAQGNITKREKLTTSLMPSGLSQILSQDELVNLVEYLASLKGK